MVCGDALPRRRRSDLPARRRHALDEEDYKNWAGRKLTPCFGAVGCLLTPYGLRHAAISLLIQEGNLSLTQIAERHGTSLEMISRHYAHIISGYAKGKIDLEAEFRKGAALGWVGSPVRRQALIDGQLEPGQPHAAFLAEAVAHGRLRQVDFLDGELRALEAALATQALANPQILRLMSVPGVNVNTAAAFMAAVGGIRRLPTAKRLIGHLGLDPKVRQELQLGGSSRRRHGHVRRADGRGSPVPLEVREESTCRGDGGPLPGAATGSADDSERQPAAIALGCATASRAVR